MLDQAIMYAGLLASIYLVFKSFDATLRPSGFPKPHKIGYIGDDENTIGTYIFGQEAAYKDTEAKNLKFVNLNGADFLVDATHHEQTRKFYRGA